MKFSLNKRYLSLLPFEVDLPKLTLVTGLNGSGKSQFLRSIYDGRTVEEGKLSSSPEEIVWRTAASFTHTDGFGDYIDFSNMSEREELIRLADTNNTPLRTRWLDWGTSQNITESELREITAWVDRSSLKYIRKSLPILSKIDKRELEKLLEDLRSKAYPEAIFHPSVEPGPTSLFSAAQEQTGLPFFLLTSQEIRYAAQGGQSVFEISLGSIFSKYRDYSLNNTISRVRMEEGHQDAIHLNQSEFLAQHGAPPWETLNEVLVKLGLSVKFAPPPTTSFTYSNPVLINEQGERFSPDALSSGEQIILQLGILGFAVVNTGQKIKKPRIVLLDEVDAPLHPAMAKSYLDVISDVLVKKFEMHVIATTHSPSTVAQADPDSIYLMEKGKPGLSKITQDHAISVLTQGVPTLSVSIDDRRQVFAESPIEAGNLERLYAILKPNLNSPLSLQFIATGTKENNSGKDRVTAIVKDLVSAGNKSVYGIIDWDKKNKPSERVVVLALGRRYGLENIILDPVALAAAAYKFKKSKPAEFYELDPNLSVFNLTRASKDEWQRIVDRITTRVLKSPPTERIVCRYRNNMELEIDKRYLEHNSHPLEISIAEAYEFFEGFVHAGSGALMQHVIKEVLVDLPEFIPVEIETAFLELLK